jgi:hypothetical protein
MVAYPSVTLLVDLSEGEGVVTRAVAGTSAANVVVGLLPGDLRAAGRARVECLQIRLEPIAAARQSHPFDDSSSAARSFTINAMN